MFYEKPSLQKSKETANIALHAITVTDGKGLLQIFCNSPFNFHINQLKTFFRHSCGIVMPPSIMRTCPVV